MTRTLSLSDTSQSPLEKVSAVGLNNNRCSQRHSGTESASGVVDGLQ